MSEHGVWVVTEHGDGCEECVRTLRAAAGAIVEGLDVRSVPMPGGFMDAASRSLARWHAEQPS